MRKLLHIIDKERLVMINLAVINLKTLLKRLTKVIIVILVLAMSFKFSKILYQSAQKLDLEKIGLKNNIRMIQNNLSFSQCFEETQKDNTSELKKILVAELTLFSGVEEEIMERENREETIEFEDIAIEKTESETTEEVKGRENPITDVQTLETEKMETTVIEANNKKDVYTDIYQSVQIKNESQYSLTEEMVMPNAKYSDTKDIIIYHTHTCESYTPTEDSQYVSTGNYRTTDLNYSVARVGAELANQLAGKGYTVIHDKTYHDYPAYTGSYTRSLSTIRTLLSTYQTVDCVFDIHRDALRK